MCNMLIVDDEPHILNWLQCALDWQNFGVKRIDTASSFEEALVKAIDKEPELCLVDVCIRGDKGYDLVARMKELGLKPDVIMMSGHDNFNYALESMKSGAKNYLLKPLDETELEKAVEKLINDKNGEVREKSVKQSEIDPVLKIPADVLPPLVNKMIMMVHADCRKKLTLKHVANLLRMNPTYLGQLFQKETQMKFTEYLMTYRLIKAANMIRQTDDKISWIANKVGYSNLNYFYPHFKDYYAVTPSEMRNSVQQ